MEGRKALSNGTNDKEYSVSEISDSILLSVKKALNVPPEETAFDADIMMHVNSALAELNQLGVGPEDPLMIEDETTSWDELTEGDYRLNMAKSWMFLEVRLMFDPPAASVLSAIERKRDEYEWRLNVAGDRLTDRTDQNGTETND
jgi:hypothetical protein